MKRDELELAIFTAANIVQQSSVYVIGSQSILGSYSEADLPDRATQSQEVDIAPLRDDSMESLATRIDVFAGEWSDFDAEHGFYIQGVSIRTAYLPSGWAARLMLIRPRTAPHLAGLCLEPHDLCAAKLARNDQKDREFVGALLNEHLIRLDVLQERIRNIVDERFTQAQRNNALRTALALSPRRTDPSG